MAFKAQVILNIDFPEAESLIEAQTTLNCWLDLIAPILDEKVRWEEVEGLAAYEDKENN